MTISVKIQGQNYKIKPEKSNITWIGEKVTGEHTGSINIKSGEFTMKDGKVISGIFYIDMNSITCTDLTDESWNSKLVGHLKSDDFFGVEKYPESKFTITDTENFNKGSAVVKGELTIKGISNPLEFRATIHKTEEGLKIYANVIVDRTKYNIRYGSGSFFDNLGDKTIYDDFSLKLNLLADKN